MNTTLSAVCSLVVRLLKGGIDLAATATKGEEEEQRQLAATRMKQSETERKKEGEEFQMSAERATLSFIFNVDKRCFLTASPSSLVPLCYREPLDCFSHLYFTGTAASAASSRWSYRMCPQVAGRKFSF